MRLPFVFGALVMALGACQSGALMEVVSSDVVDRTYKRGTVNTSLGGTRIEVAVKAKEYQGKVLLCVAVAGNGVGTFAPEWPDAIAQALIVEIDGERLLTGANFAKTYLDEETVMGKSSQCAVTSKPWLPKYKYTPVFLDIPRVSVRA
ncbi:MAG: hypothetical protein ACPGVA_04415 [Pikeienuella sp.]